ncbi:MAG: pyridoxal phosphate-dependent aminotransferase [Longimicrobiales bacterium]
MPSETPSDPPSETPPDTPTPARRTRRFTESVIRDMTRVAGEHGAINLAQGFPDFPAPDLLKDAACRAVRNDVNQYAITWGARSLREAVAAKYDRLYGIPLDPDREITITCGATEGMVAAMLALVDPGDEVVVLEPFYENYGPDAILSGASPLFLPLRPPEYRLDVDRLRKLVTSRTRALILNTPNNPTGRVFDRREMEGVAEIARKRNLVVLTDEIYEHIVYGGRHIPMATLGGMRTRTVTVSGLSKTFGITGWRIGTVVAPPKLTGAIRKVHDFLTVGAPAPLQEACARGVNELAEGYYSELARGYEERRRILVDALQDAGFRCSPPEGAYYVLADYSELSDADDHEFARALARHAGVAAVPGSSFFRSPDDSGRSPPRRILRFAFCKKAETLREAGERLRSYASSSVA